MGKILLCICLAMVCASAAWAQDSDHKIDIGVWGAGGHSVSGGTSGVGIFDAGFRLGRVLTGDHLPRFLRGNFEYAIDIVPVYIVHQGNTTYGAGFNPIDLKWNFTSARHVVPYLE